MMRIPGTWGVLLLLLPVLFPEKAEAGRVVIRCDSATAYAGMTLHFLTWRDMITYREDTLLTVKVQDDGSFEGSFTADGPLMVFVRPGVYEAWFYSEPGKTYTIVLPPRKDKSIKDFLNPYFQPVSLHMGIAGVGKDDLNRLIARFEKIYSPYFYHHARQVYVDKGDTTLERFIRSVRDTFAGADNPFFRDYMNARLAMLTVMNMRTRAPVLEEYRDFGKKVLLDNPAYMELFTQVFNRYFNYLIHHKYQDRLVSAVKTADYDSLVQVIKTDLAVDYDDFADLVALKGIYDAWYNNTFPRDKLTALLGQTIPSVKNPGTRRVALDLRYKFTRLQPGTAAPGFTLSATNGRKISLRDMTGKYVYLNFSSRISYSSLREFPLLKKLQEKYGDELKIVTVALEDRPEALTAFVREKGYDWTFLVCGDTCNLPAKYDVRAYPTYYLIGPDGKMVLSPAPAPTEDFESRFRKLGGRVRKEGVWMP